MGRKPRFCKHSGHDAGRCISDGSLQAMKLTHCRSFWAKRVTLLHHQITHHLFDSQYTMFQKALYFIVPLLSLAGLQGVTAQPAGKAAVQTAVSKAPATTVSKIRRDELYRIEQRKLLSFDQPVVELTNVTLERMPQVEAEPGITWPTAITPQVQITMDRKQALAIIRIPRYIQNPDGSIDRVSGYQLSLTEPGPALQKTSGSRVYASNSVLASGTFYMVAISSRGLYKVDYNFIKNKLGVDPAGINPANIRVYGNGGELLPENNAIVPADDLVENAIEIVDGGDGQFNPGDYFLFYANGPHSILNDSINKGFVHRFNIYSESSYYFLNFDLGPGKRIQPAADPGPSNVTVTSFNDFQFWEKDSSNPGKFGKTWWGDEFSDLPGRYLTRHYPFSFPSLDVTTPVAIRTRFGAISYAGTNFVNVSANGLLVHNSSLSSVGTSYADPVTSSVDIVNSVAVTSPDIDVVITFQKGSSIASGYLDLIEINARRQLNFNGLLPFADWNSVGPSNIANYQVQNANAQTRVWDVSDPLTPVRMNGSMGGSVLSFRQEASRLHRFIAWDGSQTGTPSYIGITANQNLHQYTPVDYIIIAPPSMTGEAGRLAAHHASKRGFRSVIVTPQQIYNEFSSGSQDISALRNYIKMCYDRSPANDLPDYVLLMGDASYDYKNRVKNNTNLVPTFETAESNDKIYGYCTDDFFGFLDDNEDINNFAGSQINTLDIGIGRLPASDVSTMAAIVNKIIHYDSPESFGPWKNNMTFNADDEDGGIHMEDGEIMSQFVTDSLPQFNNYKIYVDGFVQQSTPAGPRTPDANTAVREQIYNGTFLMNYNGHGGPLGWCEERIFSMDDVNLMTNIHKLPLFITATCDFAPFDDPSVVSAGEILLNKSDGGAIALMTTTRLVYQDQNRDMNLNYMYKGFRPMANGQYPGLGDAYRLSKNLRYMTYVGTFAAANFRKFALLGDPALPLAFPRHRIMTDSINGVSVTVAYDTLKALSKYTISGHVADQQGNLLSGFNGTVYPVIFDKPKKLTTLQNDPNSPKKDYMVQNNAIYKGKATVKNGKFAYTFVVPKDINYQVAKGKISYYADNASEDATGYDRSIYIGGSNPNATPDQTGPVIRPFLNTEQFVNGGITTANPVLLVKLSDDLGINYTGNSIGHDITATLDGNAQTTYVLNNFFEANLDDYRSGSIQFPLNNLAEGPHSLLIKAWDISNNSAEARLDFIVVNAKPGQLRHIYNYPNPFTTHTSFMFEHNMPNQDLQVTIQIYSVSGKTVKTIRTRLISEGTRCEGIEWDGRDEYGDKLAKGVYVYKLSVKSNQGYSDSQYQKLILLN